MIDEHTAGSRVFTLADVEALAADGDRDKLLQALARIELPSSLWPTKHVGCVHPLRWAWKVTEQFNPDAVLAQGHALTERGAWHRGGKAARRIRDERAGAREVEGDHG